MGATVFDAITKRSPDINVEAFKEAYHPIIAEYTSGGKLDTIPKANYEALDKLVAMGKLLIVLTSRTHGELKHMLEPDHELASRVKAFYYKDNTQFHKPDHRVFDELLAEHGLSANNCAYVGDSVSDAVATNAAGMHFIASLESGLRQRDDFRDVTVDKYILQFPEVVDAVIQLDSQLAAT